MDLPTKISIAIGIAVVVLLCYWWRQSTARQPFRSRGPPSSPPPLPLTPEEAAYRQLVFAQLIDSGTIDPQWYLGSAPPLVKFLLNL